MSSEKRQKIVKVTFEYLLGDDRRKVKYVEGEEAEKWSEMMKTACVLADIHGQSQACGELDWKEVIESK